MKLNWIICSSVVLLWCLASTGRGRTWTSYDGHTVEAEFAGIEGGYVLLKRTDGQVGRIRVERLSKEDQVYARSRQAPSLTARGVGPAVAAVVPAKTRGDPQVVAQMKPGGVLKRTAKGTTKMTYHLYTPTTFDASNPPPLIIAFSPSGSGPGILNSMKASAEKAGWLLIGCDKLKNGMKDEKLSARMEEEVIADIFASVPHDAARVYLAGFSGGAMRAYSLANTMPHPFAGIIAYGGWLGGAEYRKKTYTKYMAVAIINGKKDKGANMSAEGDRKALERRKCEVKMFPWAGGHGIAPRATTDAAMAWIQDDWTRRRSKKRP